ncbi:deoxyribodipyrimidine photolyase [Ahniella affigens]|uniref:Deoxyribodipyrimidine photolyase n=1 Tax=Ahniella affigens TaxID=2021234 RepID=A0A2P1PQ77_9GAMM|nr:cryptochrome/deoxyribodipyrimidine photo-lyase family protein [Ahniella affigens]AVP96995.1 deoxyribodipyrimidine photolyase [Ahniella affigens]
MPQQALVWFKRDLRIADHAPLALAAGADAAVALFVVEPEWLTSPECDAQHVAFMRGHVLALRAALAARGLPLLIRVGSVPTVLSELRRVFDFTHLYSHEETGPGWTYARDRAVGKWCRREGVVWHESPQNGVVRRLNDRSGWARRWQQRMDARQVVVPEQFRGISGLDLGTWPDDLVAQHGHADSRPLPAIGEVAAHACLQSFLDGRGARYRRDLSSPLTAEQGCSRLSAYLAFGSLSMRQVHQGTEAKITALKSLGTADARSMAYHLRGFAGRLRWHCHFMQKLESEPEIEFRNIARSYDGLREDAFDWQRFEAWKRGCTGYPMVDACMRSLNATGWLNFRMRAMLVSFAAYHLWLHWREPGLHLARQFLDFEPGIHWSQMQMQSGTTGINTFRMYSPSKQQLDHDPHGEFIRRWIPEYGTSAYPKPIVDEKTAIREAKNWLYGVRLTAGAKAEAAAVQKKHGSRKSGLPPSGKRRRATRHSDVPRQASLFADEGLS